MAEHPADDGAVVADSSRRQAINAILNSLSVPLTSFNVSGIPLPSSINAVDMPDIAPLLPAAEKLFMKSLVHFYTLQLSLHDHMPLVEGIVCPGVYFRRNEPTSSDPARFENNHLYLGKHGEQVSTESKDAVRVLEELRFALARFISKFYTGMYRYGRVKDRDSLLIHLDSTFLRLENLVSAIPDLAQVSNLEFDKRSGDAHDDLLMWMSSNECRLDKFLTSVLARYRKQTNTSYSVCAVGTSLVAALWMIKRYFNLGQIIEAMNAFVNNVVVKPIIYLRGELLKTSDKEEELMELCDVKATSNLMHKLLSNFSLRTVGQESADEDMLKIVRNRFEEQMERPIRNVLKGDLIELLIIQVQKVKLDFERSANYVLIKIKSNELLCALTPCIPFIILSWGIYKILSVSVKKKITSMEQNEGRRLRWLQGELDNMTRQCIENFPALPGSGGEWLYKSVYFHGLTIYILDRLQRAVQRKATAMGEWPRLREDIMLVLQTSHDENQVQLLEATLEKMKRYECLH